VKSTSDAAEKARVTGVEGNTVEVVTEKNFVTRNVAIDDINIIDESQMGVPQAASGGPVDFSFMMPPSTGGAGASKSVGTPRGA